jgi:hypothetical protein
MRLVQLEHEVGHHESIHAFFDRIWLCSMLDRIERALNLLYALTFTCQPFSSLSTFYHPSALLPFYTSPPFRDFTSPPYPFFTAPIISVLLYSSIPSQHYQPGNQIVIFPVRRVQAASYYPSSSI